MCFFIFLHLWGIKWNYSALLSPLSPICCSERYSVHRHCTQTRNCLAQLLKFTKDSVVFAKHLGIKFLTNLKGQYQGMGDCARLARILIFCPPSHEIKIRLKYCKSSPIAAICPSDINFTAWESREGIFSYGSNLFSLKIPTPCMTSYI